MNSVVESLAERARRHPERPALRVGKENYSYGELWLGIRRAATVIQHRGYRYQLLRAEKTAAFVCAYFGAHLAGAVNVLLDPKTPEDGLQRILTSLGKEPHIISELKAQCSQPYPWESLSAAEPADCDFPAADDIADLMFTSGTTGLPKCVPLRHRHILASARNINTFIGNGEKDTELIALPLCHSFGLGRLRCLLISGGTALLVPNFGNERKILKTLALPEVTGFAMVPAAWQYLKRLCGERFFDASSHLRYIEFGSAALPLEDKRLLSTRLPHTRLCMHYGLTEASRSAFMEFHHDAAHLDSVGKASPNTEIIICAPSGETLPTGEIGEICIAGEHVIEQYLAESADQTHYGSYFRTGDLGYTDAEGYICLCGRSKEIINTGGKKVMPQEVEDIICTYPGVKECACIGVPDTAGVLGEVVKAIIVPSSGAEWHEQQLMAYLEGKLEPHKRPAVIERRAEPLPRTDSGKLQRGKLS